MFLNALPTPNVSDAATSPQIGRLASVPSEGTELEAKGFADTFLAEGTGDKDLSETSLQAALDPAKAPEPIPEGVSTKIADTAQGFSGDRTELASPDFAPVLNDELSATEVSSKTISAGAGTTANPAVLIDPTQTPNPAAVSANSSASSWPEKPSGEVSLKQAELGLEAAQSGTKAPSPVQSERPIAAQPLGETLEFAPDIFAAPKRPTDTVPPSEGTNGPPVEYSVNQSRVEAKDGTTQEPVSLPTPAATTRSDLSSADFGTDSVKTTQAPDPNEPPVGRTRTEATTAFNGETRLPETQTRATEATNLGGSISPQPEARGNSVQELKRLATDTVKVVFTPKPAKAEPDIRTAKPPEISTGIPASKGETANLPNLANSNAPELNMPGGRYDVQKSGRHEDVSSHGRGRDFAPYANVPAALPSSTTGVGPTAGQAANAPLAVSPGLALDGEATAAPIPEEGAIQPAADAEVSRFDLISRDPVASHGNAYSRTEQVRHPVVMAQVAEAARTMREGQMEITLVPEELGRVRLTMTPSEAGMAVTIMAERPETLELMRRNIELLARDLSSQGFENLSFSFGGSGADSGGSMPDHNSAPGGHEWSMQGDLTDTQTPAPINSARNGLDLRL